MTIFLMLDTRTITSSSHYGSFDAMFLTLLTDITNELSGLKMLILLTGCKQKGIRFTLQRMRLHTTRENRKRFTASSGGIFGLDRTSCLIGRSFAMSRGLYDHLFFC